MMPYTCSCPNWSGIRSHGRGLPCPFKVRAAPSESQSEFQSLPLKKVGDSPSFFSMVVRARLKSPADLRTVCQWSLLRKNFTVIPEQLWQIILPPSSNSSNAIVSLTSRCLCEFEDQLVVRAFQLWTYRSKWCLFQWCINKKIKLNGIFCMLAQILSRDLSLFQTSVVLSHKEWWN